MATCLEITHLITGYLEETLEQAERDDFERHISGCEACRRYLDQMKRTIRTLGRLPPEPVPTSILEAIREQYRRGRDGESLP